MAMNKISIGMNGSMLDEQPTGVGVYSFNLINNLSRLYWNEGWQKLTVFTPTKSMLSKHIRIIKLSDFLQASKYGKLAAVSRFLWNTFYYHFQARRFDIVISPTTHGSFFLRNQVITIHDLLSLRYNNISRHQRFYFKYLLPFIVSRAKLVIAVSESTKKDIVHFLKCPPEKIQVIYNGYDDKRYCKMEEKQDHIFRKYGLKDYLVAVGPTYPHKNFEMLINAYNGLDESVKILHPLVIAGGKKAYLDFCKQMVIRLKLEHHVHFIGYVPMELMPSLYREALSLIFPSLYEGFGFPLLEAMACGCPVISSNTSSMTEVCGDAAIYFDPLDRYSMITAIEKMIYDKLMRDELSEKGLIRSRQFSWAQTATAFKKIIDKQLQLTNL